MRNGIAAGTQFSTCIGVVSVTKGSGVGVAKLATTNSAIVQIISMNFLSAKFSFD